MAFSPTDSAVLASASDDESCRVWRQDGSETTQVRWTCQADVLHSLRQLFSIQAYMAVQKFVSTSPTYRDVAHAEAVRLAFRQLPSMGTRTPSCV